MKIPALSVKQPWVNMIDRGEKTIETRTWKTNYRGPLVIASSQTPDTAAMPASECPGPFGMAVCIVELIDCRPMALFEDEHDACCRWDPDLFAWVFEPGNVRHIEPPFAVRGRQGIFTVELDERMILQGENK